MKKKHHGTEKRRTSIYKMLSRRLFALAFALWFAAMALLTWAVAEDMLRQVEREPENVGSSLTEYVKTGQHRGTFPELWRLK